MKRRVVVAGVGLLLMVASIAGVIGPLSGATTASAVDNDIVAVYADSDYNLKYKTAGGTVTSVGEKTDAVGPLVDLDDDGVKEIPFSNDPNNESVDYYDPDDDSVTRLTTESFVVDNIGGAADIDGDGDTEIVYNDWQGPAKAVDVDGDTNDFGGTTSMMGGMADWDGDGDQEVIYEDDNDNIKHRDLGGSSGTIISGQDSGSISSDVQDIDDDGSLEFVYTKGFSDAAQIVEPGGSQTAVNADLDKAGGFGDWDDDGTVELLASGDNDDILAQELDGSGTDTTIASDSSPTRPGDIGQFVSGYEVEGTVTDTDSNALSGVRVELRQSGTVDQSTTTNSSGGYSFINVDNGSYTVRASEAGYDNESEDISVDGSDISADLTLTENADPYISTASPPANSFVNSSGNSINLNATVRDQDGDLINATIYYDRNDGNGYQQVATEDQLQPGHEINASVDPKYGLEKNRWKIAITDATGSETNQSELEFRIPGQLAMKNGSDLSNADDATLTVALSQQNGSFTDTRTTSSDHKINLTAVGKPRLEAEISASSKYANQTVIITDRTDLVVPLLYESSDSGVFEQCFSVEDFTGNYPSDDTELILEKRVDGEFVQVAGKRFGASNQACLTLKDDDSYQVRLQSGDNTRTTGGYQADSDDSSTTQDLPVYRRDEEGARNASQFRWDAGWTYDSNDERDNINWYLNLSRNTSAEDVELVIYERGNPSNEIHNQSIGLVGGGEKTSHLQMLNNSQENKTWVVEWSATINDSEQSARKVLGAGGQTQWPALPPWLGQYAAAAIILMTTASVTRQDVRAGLVIIPVLGFIFYFVGFLTDSTLTAGTIVLALAVGLIISYSSKGREVA